MKNNPLRFKFSDCVHIYYKDSSCNLCASICPIEETITQEDYKIIVDFEKCVSCGACAGICPSEAFSFENLDFYGLHKKLVEQKQNTLSCKRDLPCLSAFNIEYLIATVLKLQEDLVLDIGHCSKCEIGNLLERIKNLAEEANYVLEQIGSEFRVRLEELKIQPESKQENDRRSFLKRFTKTAAGLTFWALMPEIPVKEENEEDTPKNIVEEKVRLKKRKALIEALNSLNIPEEKQKEIKFSVEKISFTSDKWIDNYRCTNCSVCYNICPTGALKPGAERLQILFEPALCIKCRVCHEVCPEDCLHLKEELTLNTFLNETEILAKHIMIPCEECMIPFSYKGDTTLCPRCRELEDEIRDLLQIGE
ncbi:4Fe-4S binding protein [Persephonella sp.]|uniref:4Fe-4S binding protein n=1 Tax=Persephonella sp. TaxID=2060922 RepID=UPI00261A9A9D|nr:4Fe-4S binding protein [Persephonella sp.]